MDTTDVLRCVRPRPIIVIEGAARASDLARTLERASGLEAEQITLRTAAALDANS